MALSIIIGLAEFFLCVYVPRKTDLAKRIAENTRLHIRSCGINTMLMSFMILSL